MNLEQQKWVEDFQNKYNCTIKITPIFVTKRCIECGEKFQAEDKGKSTIEYCSSECTNNY